MSTLNFATGLKTFKVNETAEITFNPTDTHFVERLISVFEDMEAKQEVYRKEAEGLTDLKAAFECARRRDEEIREMVDEVFGLGTCEAVFGDVSVCAMADGLPLWSNFLLAVMDQIDASIKAEKTATNPRIEKYLAKYRPPQNKPGGKRKRRRRK